MLPKSFKIMNINKLKLFHEFDVLSSAIYMNGLPFFMLNVHFGNNLSLQMSVQAMSGQKNARVRLRVTAGF